MTDFRVHGTTCFVVFFLLLLLCHKHNINGWTCVSMCNVYFSSKCESIFVSFFCVLRNPRLFHYIGHPRYENMVETVTVAFIRTIKLFVIDSQKATKHHLAYASSISWMSLWRICFKGNWLYLFNFENVYSMLLLMVFARETRYPNLEWVSFLYRIDINDWYMYKMSKNKAQKRSNW